MSCKPLLVCQNVCCLCAGLTVLPNKQALTQKVLAAWMLQDLRRFVMYDFSSVRPYLISAMSNWARADRLKYATLDANGKVGTIHLLADFHSHLQSFVAEASVCRLSFGGEL